MGIHFNFLAWVLSEMLATPHDYVTDILGDCFSKVDIKRILNEANKHYHEDDNGYSTFLEIINSILGEDVYEVE